MFRNPINRFLCQEVAEIPAGGAPPVVVQAAPVAGAPAVPAAPANGPPAVPAAAAPVAAAPAPAAAAPVEQRGPTLLERAAARLSGNGEMIQRVEAANARAQTAETALATVTQERDAARAEVTRLNGERAQLDALLTGATAQNKSAEERAAVMVATQMGVDPTALPAASQGGGDTVEALRAQLEKETDTAKQWALCDKIEKMEQQII